MSHHKQLSGTAYQHALFLVAAYVQVGPVLTRCVDVTPPGLYYSLMAFFPAAFVWRQIYGSDWYGLTDVHGLAGVIITTLKWLIFLCMPNTILNLIGQVRGWIRVEDVLLH